MDSERTDQGHDWFLGNTCEVLIHDTSHLYDLTDEQIASRDATISHSHV
jgi:hypothetical protein